MARVDARALVEHLEGRVEVAVSGGEGGQCLDARVARERVEAGRLGVASHALHELAGFVEPTRHPGVPHEADERAGREHVIAGLLGRIGGLVEQRVPLRSGVGLEHEHRSLLHRGSEADALEAVAPPRG